MNALTKFIFASFVCLSLFACSVSRCITTTQSSIKGQDTVVIQTTRQIETYDATIKPKM